MIKHSIVRLSLVSILSSSVAFAESETETTSSASMPAVQSALEIAISGGYQRGVGDLGRDMAKLDDLTGPGGGGEIQIGYRATPNFALGGYASLAGYADGKGQVGKDTDVVTATAGIKADWHFRPSTNVDPWVSLGGGMRWMSIDAHAANDTRLFGIDVARLQVGVDYRVSPTLSLSPVVGATATMFLRGNAGAGADWMAIEDRDISVNFGAGLLGRFDLFARH